MCKQRQFCHPSQSENLYFLLLPYCLIKDFYFMLWKQSGERGHPCLVPDLGGKDSSFSPLSMMLLLLFGCWVMSSSFVIAWTIAHQVSLSMGCPRQEYWSGLSFPSPGDFLDPGIKLTSPVNSLLLSHQGSPSIMLGVSFLVDILYHNEKVPFCF